ncbi:MAG: hypothetical protein ABSG15_15525 [FCB group bacterium]
MNQQNNSFVRKYFEAELLTWIYNERKYYETHPNYYLMPVEIEKFFEHIGETLKNKARINRKELDSYIESLVKLRLNYLCRPVTTIKWFVFRGEVVKSFDEITILMDYFEDYNYLLSGIRNWLEAEKEKNDGKIIYDDFERELEKFDYDTVNEYSFEEFANMLLPLISFFNPDDEINTDTDFPLESLIIFLDDKHINTIACILEKLFFDDGQRSISQNKLISVLHDYIKELKANKETQNSVEINVIEEKEPGSFDKMQDYDLLIVDENLSPDIISENLLLNKSDNN